MSKTILNIGKAPIFIRRNGANVSINPNVSIEVSDTEYKTLSILPEIVLINKFGSISKNEANIIKKEIEENFKKTDSNSIQDEELVPIEKIDTSKINKKNKK